MTTLQTQFQALNQKTLDSNQDVAVLSLETTEQLMKFHIESTKTWLAESADHVRAVLGAAGPQEAQALRIKLAETLIAHALSHARSVSELAVEAKNKMTKLFEIQVTAWNEGLVSAVENPLSPASIDANAAIAVAKSSIASTTAAIGTRKGTLPKDAVEPEIPIAA